MSIADEKFVALTTFRRNGESSSVPIGIVRFGGDLAFTTGSTSLKLKRIDNDSRVILQPCDRKGTITPGTESVSGTARRGTDDEYAEIFAAAKTKYGMQVTLTKLVGKVRNMMGKGPMADAAVVLTLDN